MINPAISAAMHDLLLGLAVVCFIAVAVTAITISERHVKRLAEDAQSDVEQRAEDRQTP